MQLNTKARKARSLKQVLHYATLCSLKILPELLAVLSASPTWTQGRLTLTQGYGSSMILLLCTQVLRKLRRLAWREHEPYLAKTMLGAAKGRYDDLPSVAALAGGLSQYHPSLGVALADGLLEEVGAPETALLACNDRWILAGHLLSGVCACV